MLLLVSCVPAFTWAQDRVDDGHEPIDLSIDVAELAYDYLVDGRLEVDDPENRHYRTLQAAYEAAPEGTDEHPTVIGIRPNVYLLQGGTLTPGMRIRKNYITFLGLTNNRRAVVLADNRGLQQGADNNGFLLDVNAVGFTCRNLTIINYCNVDYEYPGDPAKNLKKRSNVITQAVALNANGDRHLYDNVAILSRLDTMFLSAKRAYFKNVYIEGTDDWIGGGSIGYWENSTLVFPEGNGVMLSVNNVFNHCRFISGRGIQFYKVGFGSHERPSVLIDCSFVLHDQDGQIAWMREPAPPRPHRYSMSYGVSDQTGSPLRICDSSQGKPTYRHSMELSDEALRAFNPWNLLRAVPGEDPDDWDPAEARVRYESTQRDALVYRIELTEGPPEQRRPPQNGGDFRVRTGDDTVTVGAIITPSYADDQTIRWSTESELIALDQTAQHQVVVSGRNFTETAQWATVDATAHNGLKATAWIYVEPEYLDPPSFMTSPSLSVPNHGQIHLSYELDLEGRPDQSLVTWSICDDAAGTGERIVAVSRGNEPLRSLPLTSGYIGKYIKVRIEPKHQRCEPGVPKTIVSVGPISAHDITDTLVSPNFRHFSPIPNDSFDNGLWTFSDNWQIESGDGLENGYGIHSTGPARLFYQCDGDTGDMELDLLFRPDKTAGQVFSVPGSPADDGPNNLHADIYIKYDPRSRNGYSLRFWRTTQSGRAVMFQFYKIENGVGTPLSKESVLSGVFKRDTHLILRVEGNTLSVSANNTKDEQNLRMEALIEPNRFGGAGMMWSRGTSAICSRFKISYP